MVKPQPDIQNGEEDGRAGFDELDLEDPEAQVDEAQRRDLGVPPVMEVPSELNAGGMLLQHIRGGAAVRQVLGNIQSVESLGEGVGVDKGKEGAHLPGDTVAIIKTAEVSDKAGRDWASTDSATPPASPSLPLIKTGRPTFVHTTMQTSRNPLYSSHQQSYPVPKPHPPPNAVSSSHP